MLRIGNLGAEQKDLLKFDCSRSPKMSPIWAFFYENFDYRYMFIQFKILSWISDLIFFYETENSIVHFYSQNLDPK